MTTVKDLERAKDQAQAQFESIKELVQALEAAGEDYNALENAQQAIYENALSLEVRSSWHSVNHEEKPDEYRILLCTGGPAVQVIGDLSEHSEPESARLQYQDWFTPWTDYPLSSEEEETLLAYARQFYFGA